MPNGPYRDTNSPDEVFGSQTEESASLLRSALEATADGILVVDLRGQIRTSNQKFADMWRIPVEILRAKNDELLLRCVEDQFEDPGEFLRRVKEINSQPDEEFIDVLKLKDGRVMERYSRPQIHEGQVIGRVWSFRDITEKRKAEDQLRMKTMFLEAQSNSSLDGMLVVDARGKKILQNAQCNRLWGIPPEVYNNPDDGVQVRFVMSRVKDPETFGAHIAYLYANPDLIDRDEVELTDGTVLDRYSAPVLDDEGGYYGRIWSFRDLTDRRNKEEELRQSEERMRTLTASIPQIVFICGADGDNVYFNQQWVDYTGMSLEESRGHGWAQAFHTEDQSPGTHTVNDSEGYEVEYRIRSKEGEYRWFLIRGRPLRDSSDGVVRWMGTCTDIHDLKMAEEALHQAQTELEARVAERTEDLSLALALVERANQAKSEFLSRMSHELRTPLNAILGFGQILEMDELEPCQMESVQLILSAGAHLLELINEVLDIAGIDSGFLKVCSQPISLDDVVDEALALVAPLAANAGVSLVVELGQMGRPIVMAETRRLKQVMINLLSNGIKYNREGGELRVSYAPSGPDRIRIEVRDSGIGMSPEDLAKLFTPFERLSAAATDVEGSGLGLVLTQRLVAAMQGALEVESELGVGTSFFVELALCEGEELAQAS
jgi:PAS domain S-box-containing protein